MPQTRRRQILLAEASTSTMTSARCRTLADQDLRSCWLHTKSCIKGLRMKKSIYAVSLLLLAAGVCLAQSEQPSLGDLAKQHKADKKVKVFTNEDVATSSPAVDSAQPAANGSASSATSGKDSKAPEDKTGEKKESAAKNASSKDNPEVAELKQKISGYKVEQEGWKKSAKRYQDLLANETSDFRRQMYQDALQGDQNNIQVYQNKIDQAQADLAKAEKASSSL